jgi:hypothetical protein
MRSADPRSAFGDSILGPAIPTMKLSTFTAFTLTALLSACGGGGGGSSTPAPVPAFAQPQATLALGDIGADQLSALSITFQELGVSGAGVTSYLIHEGVDAPVTVNALDYQSGAAPIAKHLIAAGNYDTLFFKLTITARDTLDADVPVHPAFDPQGALYSGVESLFPLGANAFAVTAPAEDDQPFFFLHIDVQKSVNAGDIDGSITIAPRIFLSTSLAMPLDATVTAIHAATGVFEVEDAKLTKYVVQPTTCTTIVAGFGTDQAGVGASAVFANIAVGDALHLEGVLGVDASCSDAAQKAVFYHPHSVRSDLDAAGVHVVHGIVQQVDVALDGTVTVQLRIGSVEQPGGTNLVPPVGQTFAGDFTHTTILAARGEVRDLTDHADRLQVGEVVGVGVANFAAGAGATWSGTPLTAFLGESRVCGMLNDVQADRFTVAGSATKKGAGTSWPACVFWPDLPSGPSGIGVNLGADTTFVTGADSDVRVGPLSGWRLTQVCDAFYDNQLRGPGAEDGQTISADPCALDPDVDLDVDVGALTAYVDHTSAGANTWTIQKLALALSADITQKYTAWFDGVYTCETDTSFAWMNNPCIARDNFHREHITLGGGPGWHDLGQSGAGVFGTSILNAGSLVPGAETPAGSATAGWDDVQHRVLLGIDFDGDMYPFDAAANSCVGVSERVWVALDSAQFYYFAKDPETGAIDTQYLNTYADFKTKVMALQAAQAANACDAGFHANVGFGFTGVLDKESLMIPDADLLQIVPVIRAIDGSVWNGGCVADVLH